MMLLIVAILIGIAGGISISIGIGLYVLRKLGITRTGVNKLLWRS